MLNMMCWTMQYDMEERGLWRRLYRRQAEILLENLLRNLLILMMIFFFGENWNNEDIDLKTRSIITVVALMSQGITDSSLKFHLQNAKNHGVTKKEIAAIITHVAFYAGWPKGWAAFNLAKEIWIGE